MTNKKSGSDPPSSSGLESMAQVIARRARKYMFTQYTLDLVEKKQAEARRRSRRLCIETAIIGANGTVREGARLIDLSMNGARLEAPFPLPFLSHLSLKFVLPNSPKVFAVGGWVTWSKEACEKGWWEAGVQFKQNHWEINQLLHL